MWAWLACNHEHWAGPSRQGCATIDCFTIHCNMLLTIVLVSLTVPIYSIVKSCNTIYCIAEVRQYQYIVHHIVEKLYTCKPTMGSEIRGKVGQYIVLVGLTIPIYCKLKILQFIVLGVSNHQYNNNNVLCGLRIPASDAWDSSSTVVW